MAHLLIVDDEPAITKSLSVFFERNGGHTVTRAHSSTEGVRRFMQDRPDLVFLDLSIDWRVFAFTLALSVVTGIVFGLAPALTASKPDLIQTLRNSRSAGLMSFGLRSFRGWLVVAELALAWIQAHSR